MKLLAGWLYRLIQWLYGIFPDYGIAIVMVTVISRIMLVPFNNKQRNQMKHQQEISKKAEELKAKYKNNQKKQNEELQKLYHENGTGMGSCLLTLIQFPFMMCLYQAIRLTAAAGTASILLPWVTSLLVRDHALVLPIATILIQLLPQLYPYIHCFKALNLQKMSVSMILAMLFANSMFVFAIPSGVGLYYFTSGLFSALEQLAVHFWELRKRAVLTV